MSKWGCVRCEWDWMGLEEWGEKLSENQKKIKIKKKRLKVENNNIYYNTYKNYSYLFIFVQYIYDLFVYFTFEIS